VPGRTAPGCPDHRVGLPQSHQVCDDLAVHPFDHGAGGNRKSQVTTIGSSALVTAARLTVLGLPVRTVVIVQEGGRLLVDAQDDAATTPAVPTVGTAERLELRLAHRGDASATVTGRKVQDDSVNEVRHGLSFRGTGSRHASIQH